MRKLDEVGSKQIAIRISMPTFRKLQSIAEQYGQNVSAIARLAIASFIEKSPLAK